MHGATQDAVAVTSHPDHVRSLFTAKPEQAPSLTGESPLRPILGPSSVLTSVGERHLRQRRLLLPAFHGEAVQRYVEMIRGVAEAEIESWPRGRPFALAPRMQAITLDVIMAGIFGIEGKPGRGTPEHRLRQAIGRVVAASTQPGSQLAELLNLGHDEAVGPTRWFVGYLDRSVYAAIAARGEAGHEGRTDILSLLLDAETEDGERLTDQELRDELLTLLTAGHETTAATLAWALQLLAADPSAQQRMVAREPGFADAVVQETLRLRPPVAFAARVLQAPLMIADHPFPAGATVAKAKLDGRPVTPATRSTNRGLEVTVATGRGTHTLVVTAG